MIKKITYTKDLTDSPDDTISGIANHPSAGKDHLGCPFGGCGRFLQDISQKDIMLSYLSMMLYDHLFSLS